MKDKEGAINEIAHSLRLLMRVVMMMPEGTLKETLEEELQHLDWCMSIIAPIEEQSND